jgi:hypothetical protein
MVASVMDRKRKTGAQIAASPATTAALQKDKSTCSAVTSSVVPFAEVRPATATARLMIVSLTNHVKKSNQSMKPTAPLRSKLTHSLPLIRPLACPSMSHRFPRAPFIVFTTTPWISSRCPATLVRFASSRSHTPAVMLFNASRGLSLSR